MVLLKAGDLSTAAGACSPTTLLSVGGAEFLPAFLPAPSIRQKFIGSPAKRDKRPLADHVGIAIIEVFKKVAHPALFYSTNLSPQGELWHRTFITTSTDSGRAGSLLLNVDASVGAGSSGSSTSQHHPLGRGSRLPLSSPRLSFLSIVATCTPRRRAASSLDIHTIAVAIYWVAGIVAEALWEQVFASFLSLTCHLEAWSGKP
jgi:hypothetical protein